MQLVSLLQNHLLDGLSHLFNQICVELGIEVVSLVFVESSDGALLLEMLLHYPDYCLLKLFLEDVILASGIDLVEEFFLPFLELLRHFSLALAGNTSEGD